MEIFLSLIKPLVVGLIVGGVVSYLRLPVPAPSTIQGVMGVLGLTIGYMIVTRYFLN